MLQDHRSTKLYIYIRNDIQDHKKEKKKVVLRQRDVKTSKMSENSTE